MPFKKTIIVSLITCLFIFTEATTIAQGPPPPPPPSSGSTHGSNTNQTPSGGSAPIGSGHLIMLGMGVIYAAYKVRKLKISDIKI